MPIPQDITAEETALVKAQVLAGLRQKYLRIKAELISCEANNKTSEVARWQKDLDEVVLAYDRVEADL